MDTDAFAFLAVVLLVVTSLMVLTTRNSRVTIASFSIMYIGVFYLVFVQWTLGMAVIKLVAGWMTAAVLGVSQISVGSVVEVRRATPTRALFRLLAGGLAVLIAFSLAPRVVIWIQELTYFEALGGLVLMAIGLLKLGLAQQPLRVILALLLVLSGFEIIYAAVEQSTLMAGLLALVNLALALVGAYLIVSPQQELPRGVT